MIKKIFFKMTIVIIVLFSTYNLYSADKNIIEYSPNLRISFFGASITAQKEPEGYVGEFKKLHSGPVFQHGYPSQQLYNAGICYIDSVFEDKPHILFLDWSVRYDLRDEEKDCLQDNNRTELIEQLSKDAISVIVKKCSMKKIVPVFLHMPRIGNYAQIIRKTIDEYSKQFQYVCFNLLDSITGEHQLFLRDSCHTNLLGAREYAKYIYQFLTNYSCFVIPASMKIFSSHLENIQSISLKATIFQNLRFKIKGYLIGISQKIGPYSGVVLLKSQQNSMEYSLWDKWCHFERNTIKICPLFLLNGEVCIVLKKEGDHATEKLNIDSIFYTGELTDVCYE